MNDDITIIMNNIPLNIPLMMDTPGTPKSSEKSMEKSRSSPCFTAQNFWPVLHGGEDLLGLGEVTALGAGVHGLPRKKPWFPV